MPKEASPPTTTDSQRPQQKQSPNGKANRVTFASTVGSDSGGGGGVGGGGGNKGIIESSDSSSISSLISLSSEDRSRVLVLNTYHLHQPFSVHGMVGS